MSFFVETCIFIYLIVWNNYRKVVKSSLGSCNYYHDIQNRCRASSCGWILRHQRYFLSNVCHAIFTRQAVEFSDWDRDKLRRTTKLHIKTYFKMLWFIIVHDEINIIESNKVFWFCISWKFIRKYLNNNITSSFSC